MNKVSVFKASGILWVISIFHDLSNHYAMTSSYYLVNMNKVSVFKALAYCGSCQLPLPEGPEWLEGLVAGELCLSNCCASGFS